MKEEAVYKDTDYYHYKSVLKTPNLSKLYFFLKYNGILRFSQHSLDSAFDVEDLETFVFAICATTWGGKRSESSWLPVSSFIAC